MILLNVGFAERFEQVEEVGGRGRLYVDCFALPCGVGQGEPACVQHYALRGFDFAEFVFLEAVCVVAHDWEAEVG